MVANEHADLFGGLVAEVPFVDALTSMLDASLPLTVTEYDEWGNPGATPETYDYLAGYAPYENVDGRDYPPILATTSVNDTRVLYVEPAKWVARLRATAPTSSDAPTSCSRPRCRPVTAASRGATRPGASGRSSWRGCSTGWASPMPRPAVGVQRLRTRLRVRRRTQLRRTPTRLDG